MTERLIHYNPFRSVNKHLKLYLESKLQKEVVFATPQRAYGKIVQTYNEKSKRFAGWPVFSCSMIDKRIDKDQMNPVLGRLDGGFSGTTYNVTQTGPRINTHWIPMTFSYQMEVWADTRNRMESYLNILIMIMSYYKPFTIYYQEGEYLSSTGIIVLESMSETSDLDPGEELVQFRQTITFNVLTQIPVKVDELPVIFEKIARLQVGNEYKDPDSTDITFVDSTSASSTIKITVKC